MDKPLLKDHRDIGRDLDLFSFHDVAPGAVFWHPKGWQIYLTLQNFLRDIQNKKGYTEISSPVMAKSQLFKESGHFDHYKENMFHLDVEAESYSLKPMNCPESALIYRTKTRSYQDLPLRYSDFGILHRNELSGTLGGLFRVRQFTIDDTHAYVRPDQIQHEIKEMLSLVNQMYQTFGFEPKLYLSTKPNKAMGDEKLWEEAEKGLREALESSKIEYGTKEKDGAFYGPKIDIHINDSQGRDWQVATIQLDFQIPEKMRLEYVDKDGEMKRPVIIHRAIMGSLERFIGILLEHTQGKMPLWLSPVQVSLIPITDRQVEHAKKVMDQLEKAEIRVELDDRAETMQSKIRDITLQKVPYIGIIGDREIANNTISLRSREGADLGAIETSSVIQKVKEEIDKKV